MFVETSLVPSPAKVSCTVAPSSTIVINGVVVGLDIPELDEYRNRTPVTLVRFGSISPFRVAEFAAIPVAGSVTAVGAACTESVLNDRTDPK
jgi:hypothetical protein